MDDKLEIIEKYKARLNPNNDFKKVFRSLQKLNEIEMTIELLQVTGIGKVVNGLRKREGLGDFAKEIVNKWKRLLAEGVSSEKDTSEYPMKKKHDIKSEPGEYDPTGNWKMKTSTKYTPSSSIKEEAVDCEYDPTQNWKLKKNKKSAQNSATADKYVPSASPVKKKREKIEKRKKKNVNGKLKENAKASSENREAELKEMLEKAQAELKQIKKNKTGKVKVQRSPSPESSPEAQDSEPEEIEEYDPTENYKSPLKYDTSPSTHDLRSPSSEYEPSGINRSIEYDPGPANSSVDYKPSKTSYDPGSSRITDDEECLEEDEPGAYLLNRSRLNSESDRSHRLSSNCSEGMRSPDNPHDIPDSSLVCSTTLYSRNKSIDSEDGRWDSEVRSHELRVKGQQEVGHTKKSKRKSENRTNSSEKKKSKSGKKFVNGTKERTPKSPEKKHKSSSEKRKSTSKDDLMIGPSTKKVKKSAAKHEPKDAGFLFEDIDQGKNKIKKKKKKKIKNGTNSKTASTSYTPSLSLKPTASIKLDLHLPEIQTTYRPLPHTTNASPEKHLNQLTDNEAAALHSKRNTKRMQVYAGQGGGTIPKMMSLFDQCMGVLLNNIDALDVIGGVPFEIIRPVLEKSTSEQLYRLEDSNPYLLEDTDVLWKKHAYHEFKYHKPEELESWREMYLRLHDEREAKLFSLTQIIQAKEAKKKPLEKKVQLAYVGMNAKAPRNIRKAQERYGTGVRSSSHQSSSSSNMRQELRDSRMSIKPNSVTAFTVDKMDRLRADKNKKSRSAPMMAKTLKSIGRLRFKRWSSPPEKTFSCFSCHGNHSAVRKFCWDGLYLSLDGGGDHLSFRF